MIRTRLEGYPGRVAKRVGLVLLSTCQLMNSVVTFSLCFFFTPMDPVKIDSIVHITPGVALQKSDKIW
jgi:hypothetical protein